MANIVASIEYLVHEILLRLPVKSLLRFKCVSKQWLALISEPKFCHLHTLHLYRTSRVFPSALLVAPSLSPTCPIIPLKFKNVSDSFKFHNVKVPKGTVIQTFNGLLLIQRITSQGLSVVHEYFVCNPTTNQSVLVIFPTQQLIKLISLFICFEPLKSPHYKLVSIRLKNYKSLSDMTNIFLSPNIVDPDCVVNVYSSETSSWSEPGFTFTSPVDKPPSQNDNVYFNGSLYWHIKSLKKCIYLDLSTQSFKTCPMPLHIEDKTVMNFCESGGHLYLVLRSRFASDISIMELNEEGFEWSLIFHENLSLNPVLSLPFCVVKQENDEDSMVVVFVNFKTMSCNLMNSSLEDLSGYCPHLLNRARAVVYQHYQNLSFVPPAKDNCKLVFFCFLVRIRRDK
ncbi:putative F-box domain-containing protein [Lupinus albus]|uniref:Putative F-box domain-containing protein n=1 Tax=Lupinus albus TaxID=3870 RepID=A0A6A4R2N2_LUPAL|nr:putative F-box domain-containing protein [Lupinus albus]